MNRLFAQFGIQDFLNENRGMFLSPYIEDMIHIQGKLEIQAKYKNSPEINDCYDIQLLIPEDFPENIPLAREQSGKITEKIANGHFIGDKYLCLGSPDRIRSIIKKNPIISYFVEKCVIPYLYAISLRNKYGGDLIFGELSHGLKGLIEDYLELYEDSQIIKAHYLVNKKRRVANKLLCPCGCGRRLGICELHNKINDLRKIKYLQLNYSK